MPDGPHYKFGANMPFMSYPDFGAILPTALVECIPGRRLLA
jgi:hypothetical protein